MSVDKRYWAFISYSHEDALHAQWLHSMLERFAIPKDLADRPQALGLNDESFAPVFFDRAELGSSPDLTTALQAGLDASAYLIVVCSPAAARSPRVNNEVEYFVRRHGKARVLCLLVGGRPNTRARGLADERECLPSALLPGVIDDTEPLAADIRKGRSALNPALEQLAAGLLGVGLDAIRRRELQRRQKLLWRAMAAVSGVLLVTLTLAAYAWHARSEAIANAEIARREADSARQVSDFLISIFRTSAPSESLGNTITARALLDRAAARIETEKAGGAEIQSRLLGSIGTVYHQLGLNAPARALLVNALHLARDAPSAQRADALYSMALLNAGTDNAADAEKQFRDSLSMLSPCENNSIACIRRHVGLANLLVKVNRPDEALAELDAASKLLADGDSPEAAHVLDTYAYLHREQARFAQAEPYAIQGLEMRQRLFGDVHPDIAKSYYGLALLTQEARQGDRALGYARKALAMDQRVYGQDHPETLTSTQMIGILHAESGQFAEAKPYFEKTLTIRERVLGADHTETGYAAYNLGCLYGDLGQYEKGMTYLLRSQMIWEKSQGTDHPDVAYALDRQALYFVKLRRADRAAPLAERALAINLKNYSAAHPNVARSRLNLVRVRMAEGKTAEAKIEYRAAMSTMQVVYKEDSDVVRRARAEFAVLE